jgi:hypothetical protein
LTTYIEIREQVVQRNWLTGGSTFLTTWEEEGNGGNKEEEGVSPGHMS